MLMITLSGLEVRVILKVCLTPDSKMNFVLTRYDTLLTRISTNGT